MKIGIDLSPLQSPHRMRGIGATVINFVNSIPDNYKIEHEFIFYIKDDTANLYESPLELLDLEGVTYKMIKIPDITTKTAPMKGRPSKLFRIIRAFGQLTKLSDYYFGDDRLEQGEKPDVFLQFDQQQSLPKGWGIRKFLVAYDIIPYVLEWDYMYTYKTARRKEFSRLGSLNHSVHRWLYIHQLRTNARRATKLLAISEQTKQDLVHHVHIPSKHIAVTPLGIKPVVDKQASRNVSYERYVKTSWGYMKRKYSFDNNTPYLLFVGGVDRRRKLKDLIITFNHLRAQGNDLKLVLVGDIMQGPENIPIPETREALESSSYLDDIIFMGFVSDKVREVLYRNALAFVYPSIYEGFGLPVLEAMSFGSPVICYENGAVKEIAGQHPHYASDWRGIQTHVENIFKRPLNERDRKELSNFANKQTWAKASDKILKIVTNSTKK